MKLVIEFDLAEPDTKDRFERMYRADIAWNAVYESAEKIRSALKHIDSDELFRDTMIEIRSILMNAADVLDE